MATTTDVSEKQQIISDLMKAYAMEMQTVANYLAHSVNMDGVLAQEVKRALADDVPEELGHARKLANRIKQLGGTVAGPAELGFEDREELASGVDTTDVEGVIRAVLNDELAAIDHYQHIIRETDPSDLVTQDLCIQLLSDEEEHRTLFEGFLKDFEKR